jgi:hypothetical protein
MVDSCSHVSGGLFSSQISPEGFAGGEEEGEGDGEDAGEGDEEEFEEDGAEVGGVFAAEERGPDAEGGGEGSDEYTEGEGGGVLPEDEDEAFGFGEADGGEEGELGALFEEALEEDGGEAEGAEEQAERSEEFEGFEVGVGDSVEFFDDGGGSADFDGVVFEFFAEEILDLFFLAGGRADEDAGEAALSGEELKEGFVADEEFGLEEGAMEDGGEMEVLLLAERVEDGQIASDGEFEDVLHGFGFADGVVFLDEGVEHAAERGEFGSVVDFGREGDEGRLGGLGHVEAGGVLAFVGAKGEEFALVPEGIFEVDDAEDFSALGGLEITEEGEVGAEEELKAAGSGGAVEFVDFILALEGGGDDEGEAGEGDEGGAEDCAGGFSRGVDEAEVEEGFETVVAAGGGSDEGPDEH